MAALPHRSLPPLVVLLVVALVLSACGGDSQEPPTVADTTEPSTEADTTESPTLTETTEPPTVAEVHGAFLVNGDGSGNTQVLLDGDTQLETTTNSTGEFAFPAVPPGAYSLSTELAPFFLDPRDECTAPGFIFFEVGGRVFLTGDPFQVRAGNQYVEDIVVTCKPDTT